MNFKAAHYFIVGKLAFFVKLGFLAYSKGISFLSLKPGINILISNRQDWAGHIKIGFIFTGHELTFDELPQRDLKNYDLVLPLTIPDLLYLTEISDPISDNPIPIPDKKSILLCDDKYLFNQTMINSDFAHFIPAMGEMRSYPYMLKKKVGECGKNCHIIHSETEEKSFMDMINSPDYFTQEIISARKEYATHILFKDQQIIASLNIKYVFDQPISIKGRDRYLYQIVTRCAYLDIFSAMLKCIQFEGLCCINYKVRDDQPMIMEINPRCGASLSPYLFLFVEASLKQPAIDG